MFSRNLVLQELWKTGSKSYKLEVTFAIHLIHNNPNTENLFCLLKIQFSDLEF